MDLGSPGQEASFEGMVIWCLPPGRYGLLADRITAETIRIPVPVWLQLHDTCNLGDSHSVGESLLVREKIARG